MTKVEMIRRIAAVNPDKTVTEIKKLTEKQFKVKIVDSQAYSVITKFRKEGTPDKKLSEYAVKPIDSQAVSLVLTVVLPKLQILMVCVEQLGGIEPTIQMLELLKTLKS